MMLEAVTAQGDGRSNEDSFGHSLDRVWVLDGATQMVPDRLTGPETDAAIFTDLATRLIASSAHSQRTNRQVLQIALKRAGEQLRIGELFGSDPAYQPSFAMAMVQFAPALVEIDLLSDCYVVGLYDDGVRVATDDRISIIAGATDAVRERAVQAGSPSSVTKSLVVEQIHANRHRMNRDGGYWVGTADRAAAHRTYQERWPREGLRKILLCTDGFWAAVDRDLGVASFMRSEGALTAALASLRAAERSASLASGGAKAKKHDDATAVMVTLQKSGSEEKRDERDEL